MNGKLACIVLIAALTSCEVPPPRTVNVPLELSHAVRNGLVGISVWAGGQVLHEEDETLRQILVRLLDTAEPSNTPYEQLQLDDVEIVFSHEKNPMSMRLCLEQKAIELTVHNVYQVDQDILMELLVFLRADLEL